MSNNPKVIGVIPARYGSQRLPAKPLIKIIDKPLVQWVYEQASKASLLDKVIVATDDVRIEKAVKDFGGEVYMTSPEIQSGSDRVAVVASGLQGDIFVNIQGDEPLIAPEMIDEGVNLLLGNKDSQVATLVKRIDSVDDLFNPNVVKVVLSEEMNALYFSRSTIPYIRDAVDDDHWLQNHIFYKHIGMYIFRSEFLKKYPDLQKSKLEEAEKLEQLRILEAGYKIKVGITTYDSIPIDTVDDVKKVETLLKK